MKKARIIALLIAAVMVLAVCFAACQPKEFTVTYYNGTEKIGEEKVKSGEKASGRVNGFELNGNLKTSDGKVFTLDTPITADISLYGEFIKKDNWINDTKNYTYRMAPASLPTAWNYHTYQENMSTYVLDYTSDALYTMDYNDDYTGFRIVPSMASGDPVDVSSEYVGKYGISEGETGKAYKIPIKTNLRFDNGEAINANTFVRSMRNLLNPQAANYRADNMWKSGSIKIYGAEDYAKQNSTTFANTVTNSDGIGEGKYVGWATVSEEIQKELFFSAADCFVGSWLVNQGYVGPDASFSSEAQAMANMLGETITTPQVESLQGKSLFEIKNSAELNAILEELIGGWCTIEGEEFGFFCTAKVWDSYNFEDVGYFAPSDYELVIVLINAMEDNFYLRYELCTSFFLVNNTLYEQRISTTGGVYSNDYGTSVSTYVGYGPYKLVEFIADNKIRLERNTFWHGYYEDELAGQYQTTAVEYVKVENDETRLEMFLKGEIDSYGLRAEDMSDYVSSKYTYFNDSESTWFVAMNPSVAKAQSSQALATPVNTGYTVVKTPITVTEFRQAMSYSLDRLAFTLALSPTSGVGKSLMSVMQYYDPENGLSYRSTNEAKDAILEFWGLADAWGPGKEYETRDEAIDAITGYDPAGAKTLFQTAYTKAVDAGYITQEMITSGKWEVQIMIGASNWASAFYSKGFDNLSATWANAVKGTPFEGHLTFVKSGNLGGGYNDALRQGKVDLLFGVGFGGSMFDPFTFMDVFTGELQYDPDTDKKQIPLDIEINGQVLRASLYDWVSEALQGNTIDAKVVNSEGTVTSETVSISAGADADVSLRLKIMARAETKILELSNMIPLMTDSSASLRCMRIVYKTEDYILGPGRGGIQYYTYTHSDEEFAAFVAQQGGTLNYKVTE